MVDDVDDSDIKRNLKLISARITIIHWTRVACKKTSRLHMRQIVLKNVIYLLVQNIHTYPFAKPYTILNLAAQNVFYIQFPNVQFRSCFRFDEII